MADSPTPPVDDRRWYEGITRYQWLVLLIASLGWVFDIFEGQIFVASMNEAMPSLMEQLPGETEEAFTGRRRFYDNIALAAFLLGGATGGIIFGMLSDRIGRKQAMTFTILFYSLFTCVSAFSQEWWHLAGLRFLVAMGVGGEWAVASSLVFEVFPRRARAHVGGIFHASSIFGTWLAIAAGAFIIGNPWFDQLASDVGIPSLKWRLGFALGVLPALLIIWIRKNLKEPESWHQAKQRASEDSTQQVGRLQDLFASGLLLHTVVGFTLAAVGMATFWGVHIYGKDVFRAAAQNVEIEAAVADPDSLADPDVPGRSELVQQVSEVDNATSLTEETRTAVIAARKNQLKRWEMLGMFLVTTGGGIGLVSFGPISQRIGRRAAFLIYHVGGLIAALAMFQIDFDMDTLYVALPIFGFLTLGMHAGYAIYFPELYPTRLRGTGTGFCFNAGRIAAAPILFIAGWLQKDVGLSLGNACSLLSLLYLVGAVVLLFAPETRGRELFETAEDTQEPAGDAPATDV
ncbi:Putative sialic acid transporter [Maioricimonas rarisocia]|uniref:Sialic acid transporter n=1 Tax=Maioricimonas rarisocia TaxID=2528026 RepID=A0A517ZFT2_9PLAN|nr:MFS transporter [Maioricimonas rarisocia]QDU41299.1 Putative sialic acid transporter [Maioricimonas rarisocia]